MLRFIFTFFTPALFFILAFIFPVINALAYHQSEVITVSNPDDLLTIGKQFTYFEDKSGVLTIEEIQSSKIQEQFILNNTDIFAKPATSSVYWFKISVANQSDRDLWLSVGSTFCWEIDFYSPGPLGKYSPPIQTGSLRPFENRIHKIINAFWLPLNKKGTDEVKVYYLRLAQLSPFEVPIQIGSLDSLNKEKRVTDMLTAGFTGIILIMVLYNFFLGFSTKDTIYWWYVAHLATAFFAVTCMNSYPLVDVLTGYRFPAFWQEHFFVWLAPNPIFAAVFAKKYLNLKNNSPIYNRIIDILLLIIIAIALINLTDWMPYIIQMYLFQIVALLLTLIFFLAAVYVCIFKRVKHAKFYLYGWTFYFISISLSVAAMNGLISYNIFFRDAIYFGLSLEVWMFSMALGEKMWQLKLEKAEIQAEHLRLVEEQVELLETKVEKRTKEIQMQKEDIQSKNQQIMEMNESLERKVRDRTEKLLQQNDIFKDYAFTNAHKVRGPLARMLGLFNVLESEKKEFPYFEMLNDSANELDFIVKEMNDLLAKAEFFEDETHDNNKLNIS